MSGFDDYADAVIDQRDDFLTDVACGLVEHDRPLTREDAEREDELRAEHARMLADLFDNDNPESLWYR